MTSEDAHLLKSIYDGVTYAADMQERVWGVDRLPMLVSDETRAKYTRQLELWNEALSNAWAYEHKTISRDALEEVQVQAKRMKAAWRVMSGEARLANALPLEPNTWEIALDDGTVAVFALDMASASAVVRSGRAVTVWTPQEVANLIKALPELLTATKHHFPGATVIPARKRVSGRVMDEAIPF